MSPANGEESHWEVGGQVEPQAITITIHVCEDHNALQEQEVWP